MHARRVETEFAAAAKRHALRGGDDGFGRVLDRQIHVLELAHGEMQLVPLLLLRGDKNEHEVCADGKIRGLVGDHHRVEIGIKPFNTLVQHGDQVGADGVHLGVEFAADHAVAKIDQAGAWIALDLAAGFLEGFENDDPGGFFHAFGGAGGEIEASRLAFLRLVERLAA